MNLKFFILNIQLSSIPWFLSIRWRIRRIFGDIENVTSFTTVQMSYIEEKMLWKQYGTKKKMNIIRTSLICYLLTNLSWQEDLRSTICFYKSIKIRKYKNILWWIGLFDCNLYISMYQIEISKNCFYSLLTNFFSISGICCFTFVKIKIPMCNCKSINKFQMKIWLKTVSKQILPISISWEYFMRVSTIRKK